jgi:hypothetical protein
MRVIIYTNIILCIIILYIVTSIITYKNDKYIYDVHEKLWAKT